MTLKLSRCFFFLGFFLLNCEHVSGQRLRKTISLLKTSGVAPSSPNREHWQCQFHQHQDEHTVLWSILVGTCGANLHNCMSSICLHQSWIYKQCALHQHKCNFREWHVHHRLKRKLITGVDLPKCELEYEEINQLPRWDAGLPTWLSGPDWALYLWSFHGICSGCQHGQCDTWLARKQSIWLGSSSWFLPLFCQQN